VNELALSMAHAMTVKQVAEALNVSDQTILNWVNKLYPGMMQNGRTTYLGIEEVTRIKQSIGTGRNDLQNVLEVRNSTTELEIAEMTLKVISYHKAESDRLRAELVLAAPKVESFNALMRSEKTMSITDAAKHFGLHPKAEVFPYLRDRGYLTSRDLPSQAALDADYLALRKAYCLDGTVREQAVVLDHQLEIWRTRVVPQIAHWKAEATA